MKTENIKLQLLIVIAILFAVMVLTANVLYGQGKVPNYFKLSSQTQGVFLLGNDYKINKNEKFIITTRLEKSSYIFSCTSDEQSEVTVNGQTLTVEQGKITSINIEVPKTSILKIEIKSFNKKINFSYCIHWINKKE